jgi:hypothetical protein
MPIGYAIRAVNRSPEKIVELLKNQGVELSDHETMEIGSTKSPYQSGNIPFEDICDNPRIQGLIGAPHSDIWYSPTKGTINAIMYNIDPKKMDTETYHQVLVSEMIRVLSVLEKKLPQADLRLAGRIAWDKKVRLSDKDVHFFEEAKEAYKTAMEIYRTGMA